MATKQIHVIKFEPDHPGADGGYTIRYFSLADTFAPEPLDVRRRDDLDFDKVTAWCKEHGYLLHGPVLGEYVAVHASIGQRIDIAEAGCAFAVTRMRREHHRDIPFSNDFPPLDFDAAVETLRGFGYRVYTWRDSTGRCARAFFGEPWPIRRSWEIARKRQDLNDLWHTAFTTSPSSTHWTETLAQQDLAFAG